MNAKINIKLIGLVGVVVLTMACALGTPAQPQIDTVGTTVAVTMQALTARATTQIPPIKIDRTQISGTPFSFRNISFVIPDGVASGAHAEVIPDSTADQGAPWDAAPEHILIELTGLSISNPEEIVQNMILIYPAKEYAAANPGATNSILRLKAILADPSLPITTETQPIVPAYNASALIAAQSKTLDFQNGRGVRLITEYAQFPAPITKFNESYQYAGLTDDGKYFVIVILPVEAPLQSTSENPSADGAAYPDMASSDATAFKTYYQAMADKLNAADPNSFHPAIGQWDALIQSITIAP